jgi:hypothetical protein
MVFVRSLGSPQRHPGPVFSVKIETKGSLQESK